MLGTVSGILMPLFYDILPVSLVMMFHARNLNSTIPGYQEAAGETTVSKEKSSSNARSTLIPVELERYSAN